MSRASGEAVRDRYPKRDRLGSSQFKGSVGQLMAGARMRLSVIDSVTLTLFVVFLAAAAFYLWTAGTSFPLALHSNQPNAYSELANAFLHLSLSVGHAPAGLLRLANPYDPNLNASFRVTDHIHDYVLYHDHLYLIWGPGPALFFLPLRILGIEPSTSLVAAAFAIAGLGFALGTLRVVLRQIGSTTLWSAALAALVLALCSVVPFILRRPEVYEEAITGGYCFAMAGIWLAASALAQRRGGLVRLAIMSCCFGLAGASRPTLWFAALMLAPVYMRLRGTESARELLSVLLLPVGACFVLVLAYNEARFGSPLEVGVKYQLAGYEPSTMHFGNLSYVTPGAWLYALVPPRFSVLFPFFTLGPPPLTYPGGLPSNYGVPESTGGLLPMSPILIFLLALPWLRRYRPTSLGTLSTPLLLLAGAGVAIVIFLAYEFNSTTERYAVDFSTLFLLGALAAWLALSEQLSVRWRWLVRTGGAVLAVWGCLTGVAISFTGYANLLQVVHPATWVALEKATRPISTAITKIVGHPVLVTVRAPQLQESEPTGYVSLGAEGITGLLAIGQEAQLTIVSPDGREAGLVANIARAAVVAGGLNLGTGAERVLIGIPGRAAQAYEVPPNAGGVVHIPIELHSGVNQVYLAAESPMVGSSKPAIPTSQQGIYVRLLSLSGRD
jgi:hypothetical protein